MESTFGLEGKVALITGSTRGIGWESARTLARHGATIILNGRNQELLQQRVVELRDESGAEVHACHGDVGDPDVVKKYFGDLYQRYKGLDILVNNAGILEDRLLGMVTRENMDAIFHVNIQGVILNMQYASRLMVRKRSGSIVNISSIIGRYGNAGQVVYGASKAAVIGATLSASKELAAFNVRVNAIAPGFIDTDMARGLSAEKFAERLMNVKMGKIGTPEDVARAVLFFASDLSAYVTGQVLGVDGGMLI